MDKKDYISGNLYKMTRNNADFNPQTNAVADVSAPSRTISSAQQRRLTDVYNAKLDLMGRMERAAKKLSMLNDELEKNIELRRKTAASIQEKLEKLENLTEPDGGRELHEYMREVEHLRMEYFRMEAEIEYLSDSNSINNTNQSFWEEFSNQKSGHLMKLSFVFLFPVLLTIIICALVVGAAVIFAMKI